MFYLEYGIIWKLEILPSLFLLLLLTGHLHTHIPVHLLVILSFTRESIEDLMFICSVRGLHLDLRKKLQSSLEAPQGFFVLFPRLFCEPITFVLEHVNRSTVFVELKIRFFERNQEK